MMYKPVNKFFCCILIILILSFKQKYAYIASSANKPKKFIWFYDYIINSL